MPGKARPVPAHILHTVAMRSVVGAPAVLMAARCIAVASSSASSGSMQQQPRAVQAGSAAVAQIKTEEDNLWTPDTREGHAEIRARGAAFLRWLLVRDFCTCRYLQRVEEAPDFASVLQYPVMEPGMGAICEHCC